MIAGIMIDGSSSGREDRIRVRYRIEDSGSQAMQMQRSVQEGQVNRSRCVKAPGSMVARLAVPDTVRHQPRLVRVFFPPSGHHGRRKMSAAYTVYAAVGDE